MIMGIREMADEAEAGIDRDPGRSPAVREACDGRRASRRIPRRAGSAGRRHGHPVRRGLGLRHLRRLRRGVPGDHRARGQDRRPAAQPRARGQPVPAGADGGVPRHGERRQPVGPAAGGAARLDEGPAVRRPDRRRGEGRRAELDGSRSCTGWAARPRSTTATSGSPARWPPAWTPPGSRSRCSARRSRAPATRPAAWATSTSSRCWPGQNIETLNRYGIGERTIVTACPHCFNTIGNEYGQLGGQLQDPSTTAQYLARPGRERAARARRPTACRRAR